jgi:hypothetical protein
VGQVDKSEWRSRIIRFPIRQVDKFDGGGRSRIDRISLICPRPSLHPQKGRPGLSSMGGGQIGPSPVDPNRLSASRCWHGGPPFIIRDSVHEPSPGR